MANAKKCDRCGEFYILAFSCKILFKPVSTKFSSRKDT